MTLMAIWPFGKNKRIYLDHAAATPLDGDVARAMTDAMREYPGNPSAIHAEGVAARELLEEKRAEIATSLGVHSDEIIFTSGGSEGNLLAIAGAVRHERSLAHGNHLVVSAFEHQSVLETVRALEKEGWEVSLVAPEPSGVVDPKKIAAAVRQDTVLVSVMLAQNEIGTILPLAEIVRAVRRARKHGSHYPLVHTDACQAIGHIPVDLGKLGVDLATVSAHKMYGPRGIGVLYKKRAVELVPLSYGGGQELGLRSGTENLGGVAGMAAALEKSLRLMPDESRRLESLRDYAERRILAEIPHTLVHGKNAQRLPHHLSVSIEGVDSEEVVIRLDARGIAVSTGSACATNDLSSGYVILSLGKSVEVSKNTLRVTLGRDTKKSEIDRFIAELARCVLLMRNVRLRGYVSDAV